MPGGPYTYPGVYVEEIPSGVHPISGVSTSNTAFIDRFVKGPQNTPIKCTSFDEFEEAFGGLDADMRRRLRRSSGGGDVADRLEPGTRLTREWKGVPHEVTVREGTYLYAGKSWKSLSEIGRHITGVRVNGPKFFGLRPEPRKAAA